MKTDGFRIPMTAAGTPKACGSATNVRSCGPVCFKWQAGLLSANEIAGYDFHPNHALSPILRAARQHPRDQHRKSTTI
ncbi:hypothetical protein AGR2A_Cc160177 [Agrobacterium genomosp. 2 str. CFBP 5494]|uniref:Uncharacterized protein n=1 Tax=Agrobacterium genomosp. 2 str. CFBP 5494 TaxID=1183436 RepID=A0A9W5F209_9HYPH|nr:hypothetical protein AGR2A_Cc160177 [Agrobacterium genomosp. 2 str. CFBP 5494]